MRDATASHRTDRIGKAQAGPLRLWLGLGLLLWLPACPEDGAGGGVPAADADANASDGADAAPDAGDVAGDPARDVFDGNIGDATPDGPDAASDADAAGDTAADADAEPEPVPPPRPEISSERLGTLQAAIDDAFSDELAGGRDLTALVAEAESGRVLYESGPDLALVPASNTKLFTTAAAFALLGEDYRFRNRVYADVAPGGGGAIAELTVVIEHDLSYSSDAYGSPRFPFDRLAADLYGQGVRAVEETVRLSGELFYGGSSVGEYDAQAQRDAGVAAFRAALAAAGIDVSAAASATTGDFEPPAGTTQLASWESLPLTVASAPINRASHNQMADILMRHLGYVYGDESTYAAGFAEVVDWLESSGFDAEGLSLSDGSGLSYANRVSARHIVDLFRLMEAHPAGAAWLRTMSVGGVRGTLASRLTGGDTVGRVLAKSGSLNITIAMSGVVVNRYDGRRYVFSFILNDDEGLDQPEARVAEDAAITAVAGDLLETAERPSMPTLIAAQDLGDGEHVRIRWESSGAADGYFVWTSADGATWDRQDAHFVGEPFAEVDASADASPLYVRVSAVSAEGESDVSSVYAASRSGSAPTLLIVDGNERWQREPVAENTLGAAHTFVVDHAEVLGVAAFDSASAAAVRGGAVDLDAYGAVLWLTGEESTGDETFGAAEQSLLAAYADAGGNLLVTGAEIGWDLVEEGAEADAAFYGDVLRAGYVGDDAGTFLVEGGGGIFADLALTGFFTPDEIVVSYPDQLSAGLGSMAVLDYVGGAGGVAGIQYDGDYRMIYLGFPFESVASRADRAEMMGRVLAFFELAEP